MTCGSVEKLTHGEEIEIGVATVCKCCRPSPAGELVCVESLGTTRSFGREFAFDCAEDCLGMHALAIAPGGKSGARICARTP